MTNAWGHADGVDPDLYGENSAGPWSEATGEYIFSDVPTADAAPWSLVDAGVVNGDIAGNTGPLGGSTPGENPLA